MKPVERALMDAQEESSPHLEVMAASNGESNRHLESPVVLRATFQARRPRAELAALGWEPRAMRLNVQK
jgi:hypothetical protein